MGLIAFEIQPHPTPHYVLLMVCFPIHLCTLLHIKASVYDHVATQQRITKTFRMHTVQCTYKSHYLRLK